MKVFTDDGIWVELTTEQALESLEKRIRDQRHAVVEIHGKHLEASIETHLQRLSGRIEALEKAAEEKADA